MSDNEAMEQELPPPGDGGAEAGDELLEEEPSGEELPDEAAAELAAVAEAERDELAALRSELQEARDALEAERSARHAAVERYRGALLAAEPSLPPDLIEGEDLAAVDASVDAARRTVAQIRERIATESEEDSTRGFPAGAPERRGPRTEAMSAAEKIAYGLEQRTGA